MEHTNCSDKWKPLIVCFVCRHSLYDKIDLDMAANIRMVQVPCAGRINPQFVLRALQRGADAVVAAGCSPCDCRFPGASCQAGRWLLLLQKLLVFIGMEPERFKIAWLGRDESGRFTETILAAVESAKTLGPNTVLKEEL